LATSYEARRDQICAALQDAGLTPSIPAGAYYVLANASRIAGASAKEKARTLLRETGVASVAGSAFFRPGYGEDLLRFCFGKKPADLDRACELLRKI